MTLPSCVPATSLETSGVDLNSYDLALLIDAPWVLGIAEMMNFPGVINCDSSVLSKVRLGLEKHKRVDGHAPHLSGKALNAYVAAGIRSDHECTTVEEAVEKLRLGMYLMVREATGARDLESLLPVLKILIQENVFLSQMIDIQNTLKSIFQEWLKKLSKTGLTP